METPTTPPLGAGMMRYADYDIREFTVQCYRLRKDGTYKIGPRTVTGWVHKKAPWLGFHAPAMGPEGAETCYSVTHLPSGKLVTTVPTQAAGRQLVGSLQASGLLASTAPNSSECSQVWALVSTTLTQLAGAATPSPRSKSGRQRGTGPSSFSPVPPKGTVPTPRTRVALNTASLVLGRAFSGSDRTTDVFASIADAASVQWREEIVVRVTQAPRAILLESDIPGFPTATGATLPGPSRTGKPNIPSTGPSPVSPSALPGTASPQATGTPSSGACLRDGTPATPGEFRRRYQVLMDLGDRLRQGSLAFSNFYAEGEELGWTVARLEKWERADARFRQIVGEGWMIWSGAAFCLAVAPPPFLANVEAKLGYVGGKDGSWHELGIKTLLRWPEIMAVQPLRREMREKIWKEL